MKKLMIFLLLLIVITAAGLLVKKIFFPDENEKIRQTISATVSAAEYRNVSLFMKQFTLDYRDDFENTYGTLYLFVREDLSHYRRISIRLSQMEINLDKNKRKEAEVKFFATAEAWSDFNDQEKEAGRFYLKLRKEQFRWKIYYFGELSYNFE